MTAKASGKAAKAATETKAPATATAGQTATAGSGETPKETPATNDQAAAGAPTPTAPAAAANTPPAAETSAPKISKANEKLIDQLFEEKSTTIEAGKEQDFSDMLNADKRFNFHTWHFDYSQPGGVTVKAIDTKKAEKEAE